MKDSDKILRLERELSNLSMKVAKDTLRNLGMSGGGGIAGPSAYDEAVEEGFEGTEQEWLKSLQGADGVGVPPGGTATQVLSKINSDDFNTQWVNASGAGDIHYEYDQSIAAATWNINHSLGKFPSVSIVDTSGDLVRGQINYIDNNSLTITFSAAFAGKAYLN
jgi:hypothetical protein